MIKSFIHKIFRSYNRKVIVLMYHHIANPETDPWQIAVSPENFEGHLVVLRKSYKVISVPELARQLKNKKIEADSVCITFDDAYTDNYRLAKPLLEKYEFPATFFVPAHYIGKNKQFWWDELENIILHSAKLPLVLLLSLGGELFEFKLDNEILTKEDQQKQRQWIWHESPPTKRCELYLELWKRLQPLTAEAIEIILKQLREWAEHKPKLNEENFAMDNRQLKGMFNEQLFNIGIHTLTHPALAYHEKHVQSHEIEGCKTYLEDASGLTIDTLAYPYGNYNDVTLSVVKEQNLSVAFTTKAEVVYKSSSPYTLGRLQVVNQSAQEFEELILKWLKVN